MAFDGLANQPGYMTAVPSPGFLPIITSIPLPAGQTTVIPQNGWPIGNRNRFGYALTFAALTNNVTVQIIAKNPQSAAISSSLVIDQFTVFAGQTFVRDELFVQALKIEIHFVNTGGGAVLENLVDGLLWASTIS